MHTEISVNNVDGPVALDWRANFMGLPWGRLYGYGRLDAAGEGYASLMLEGVASDTLDRAAEAFREALHEAGLHAGTLADLDDLASIDRALGLWQPGSAGLAQDHISALQTVVAEADPRSMAADTARFVLARALIVRGEGKPENLRDAHGLLGTLMEKGKDLRFVRGLASGLAADGSLHYLYQPYAAPARACADRARRRRGAAPQAWPSCPGYCDYVALVDAEHDQRRTRRKHGVDG